MLTLFSVPKSFHGHTGIIQTNALQSWLRLGPDCEIILFGEEGGTAETAARFGVRHAPDVSRNEYGTPLLNDVFERAQAMASHNLLCYVNADIILLSDFKRAVDVVARFKSSFLMVGKRQDLDLDRTLDFKQIKWERILRYDAYRYGSPRPPDYIDYFVFPKGFYKNVPPFAVGRTSFDNWLVWKAREMGASVVDASATVMAIHQNHDYSHHSDGWTGVFKGPEAKRNRQLMGGRRHYFTVADATHRLSKMGLKRNLSVEHALQKLKFSKRALHDWRHQRGLNRAKIEGAIRNAIGIPKVELPVVEPARKTPYVVNTRLIAGDTPLVSIVIPCRNVGHYLPQAIDSVLQQDYPRLECIVMDGGSTDDTLEILRRYEGRIQWRSEPDGGPQDAINKGWKICNGEILAWLNADDLWEPGAASKAVSYFLEHPEADVVYGDCGLIGPSGEQLRTFHVQEWDLKHAVEYCDHIIHQAASFMRRDILERVGWLYPKLCHDHELWLRISLAGGKLQRIPALLAHARDRSENLGHRSDLMVPLKVSLSERFFDNPGLPPELARIRRRAISNSYLRGIDYVLKDSLSRDQSKRAIMNLVRRAVLTDPLNFLRAIKRLRSGLKHLSRKSSPRRSKREKKPRRRQLAIVQPPQHNDLEPSLFQETPNDQTGSPKRA